MTFRKGLQMESRKRRNPFTGFLPYALFCTLFAACSDHGVEADFFRGTVQGKLQVNSIVPAATDEIRVALVQNFPPSSLQGLITSGVIAADKDTAIKQQTLSFEVEAPLGHYEAAIVLWKALDESFQLTDIIGIFGNLQRFELQPINLTAEAPVQNEVNIPLDLSRVNRTSTISGRIDFQGAWPENTSVVTLVVLRNLSDLTNGIPPAITFIPRDAQEFDYRVGVAPDEYSGILVAWLPVGDFDLANVRILGFFEDPAQPGLPAPVSIGDGEAIANINIVANFANINE